MDMDFAAKRKISMLDLQWMMRASDALDSFDTSNNNLNKKTIFA